MSKNICFFVTEIAGLMNKNPYQDHDDSIHHFMNRIIDNKRKENVKIPKKYEKMIEKNINESEITKVQKKIKDIHHLKCNDEIKEEIKRKIYTERGKLYESHAIDDYQKEIDLHIQTPNDFVNRFYIKNNIGFSIGGRLDGYMINNKGETIIIEVKNRQNKIFDEIPIYEQIQMECYVRMMRAKECIFIQRYDHKNHIKTYYPNQSLWDEILLCLSVVSKNVQIQNSRETKPKSDGLNNE